MLRKIVVVLARCFFKIYLKVEVIICERFEKLKSGCIVTPNHISASETVIVPACRKRVMYMMAKEEMFKNKFLAKVFDALKVFPIARGKKDFMAIKKAVSIAENGNAVCIFPEGTRNKNVDKLRFKPGATMVAYEAKVPVVPVGIVAEKNYKFRSKVYVVYGEPIYFNEYYDKSLNKEDLRKLTGQLEDAVQKAIDSVKG